MKIFTEFEATSTEEWRLSVEKELKGLSFDSALTIHDEIEGIYYPKFSNERSKSNEKLTHQRSSKTINNDWIIGKIIEVKDEKIANHEALIALNQGANSLTFVLLKKNILWSALFSEIALDFIETQFKTIDLDQTNNLVENFSKFSTKAIVLLNDSIENKLIDAKNNGVQLSINSYGVQQAGANAIQEIVFALSACHTSLFALLEKGFKIDEAAKMLRFEMGIGSNYFIEIAKFRVFRKLWSTIVDAYQPEEKDCCSCFIYAKTGFINKSLKDPYTNLLRQTTEAMSAIIGGANEIQIQAYDKYAQNADRSLSERMAVNISNILKEESYFDKVIDPLGGSYNLNEISNSIETQAWELFQEIEKLGGIESLRGKTLLQSKIMKTAKLRIAKIQNRESILIGINKYDNPDIKSSNWMEIPSFFDLEPLILEKI